MKVNNLNNIKTIWVIGAGNMGATIALWFASKGNEVFLTDSNKDSIVLFEEKKQKFLKRNTLIGEIHLSPPLSPPDLILEAVVESYEIKKKVFQEIIIKFSPSLITNTLFATNTSSLSIQKIADFLPSHLRNQFYGIHFFNPADKMKLVELIYHHDLQAEQLNRLHSYFESLGKVVAVCKDSPGFIVNRIARNYYLESLRILQQSQLENGVAILDSLMKTCGGFKMGPFELMDLIGIDVNYQVSTSIWESFERHPRFTPSSIQQQMVANNQLGMKTKKGFYPYD